MMDNSNLMLLCNTLNSESAIRKNTDCQVNIDIKVEQADETHANKAAIDKSLAPVSHTVVKAVANNEVDQNNSNIQLSPCKVMDEDTCCRVDVQGSEASTSASSFDSNLSYNESVCCPSTSNNIQNATNNLTKVLQGSSNNPQTFHHSSVLQCSNSNAFQNDKMYPTAETAPMDSSNYQVYQAVHMSDENSGARSSMESIGQSFSGPNFQPIQSYPHSTNQSADLCWTQAGQTDSLFGSPIGSSTPAGGRLVTGQYQDGSSFVQSDPYSAGYQTADPHSWHGQEKEQLQWVSTMVTAIPQGLSNGTIYNQPQALYDRNWNVYPDAGQTYMNSGNQNLPLDMSLTTDPEIPRRQQTVAQHRLSFSSESPRQTGRPQPKRSHTAAGLALGCHDTDLSKDKTSKADLEKIRQNYEISTNVHTLKPRHIVAWYIDHLMRENEDITDISKSNTWRDVNIYQSKDMYFMEPLLKKTGFPSPKFLSWMHGNFPNININAIDFTEGRKSNFLANYEDELSRKTRNEIITDTFLYFQQRKSIKID